MRLDDAEDLWLACVAQAPAYADHSLVTRDQLSARAKRVLAAIIAVKTEGWPTVSGLELQRRCPDDLRTIDRRIDVVDAPATLAAAEKALISAWADGRTQHLYRRASEVCAESGREAASSWLMGEMAELEALAAGVRWRTSAEVAHEMIATIRARLDGTGPGRLQSGLSEIDRSLAHWAPSRMTGLGGWTSQGKSTLAAQLLTGLSIRGVPTAMISLEDEETITVQRQFAMIVDELATVQRLSAGEPSAADMMAMQNLADEVMAKWPFKLVHAPGWPVEKIAHAAQDAIRRWGARVVAIDYLQCCDTSDGRRSELLGNYARKFKAAVTSLGSHLLLLSQLVRPEGRNARTATPTMYMLKESGDIENVCDYVMLVHRPEKGDDSDVEDARIIVDKAKDGTCGMIPMVWDSVRNLFTRAQSTRSTYRGGNPYTPA